METPNGVNAVRRFTPGWNLAVLSDFFHRDWIKERHGCAQLFADDFNRVFRLSIAESLELLAA